MNRTVNERRNRRGASRYRFRVEGRVTKVVIQEVRQQIDGMDLVDMHQVVDLRITNVWRGHKATMHQCRGHVFIEARKEIRVSRA